MSDLISRQAALDTLKGFNVVEIIDYEHGVIYVQAVINAIYNRLNNLPSAEPEQKKGKWWHYEGMLTCSECGMEFYDDIEEYCGDDVPKFCPECGADVRCK